MQLLWILNFERYSFSLQISYRFLRSLITVSIHFHLHIFKIKIIKKTSLFLDCSWWNYNCFLEFSSFVKQLTYLCWSLLRNWFNFCSSILHTKLFSSFPERFDTRSLLVVTYLESTEVLVQQGEDTCTKKLKWYLGNRKCFCQWVYRWTLLPLLVWFHLISFPSSFFFFLTDPTFSQKWIEAHKYSYKMHTSTEKHF